MGSVIRRLVFGFKTLWFLQLLLIYFSPSYIYSFFQWICLLYTIYIYSRYLNGYVSIASKYFLCIFNLFSFDLLGLSHHIYLYRKISRYIYRWCAQCVVRVTLPALTRHWMKRTHHTLNENAEPGKLQTNIDRPKPNRFVRPSSLPVRASPCGLPGIVVGRYKLNAGNEQLLHAIAHGIGHRFTPRPHKLPIQVSFEAVLWAVAGAGSAANAYCKCPLTTFSFLLLFLFFCVWHVVAKCCACQLLKPRRNRFHHQPKATCSAYAAGITNRNGVWVTSSLWLRDRQRATDWSS